MTWIDDLEAELLTLSTAPSWPLQEVSGTLATSAVTAQDLTSQLTGVGFRPLIWESAAAAVFESTLGPLPGYLNSVAQSFTSAGRAIGVVWNGLQDAQRQANQVLSQLGPVRQRLLEIQNELRPLIEQQLTVSGTGAEETQLKQRIQSLQRELDELEIQLSQLCSQGQQILETFGGVVGRAAQVLQEASAEAIPSPPEWQQWAEDAIHAYVTVDAAILHVVESVVKGVFEAALGVLEDLAKLVVALEEGKGWAALEALSDLCHNLSTVLGFVALVCAFIPGIGDAVAGVLTVINIGLSAAGTVADAAIDHHTGDWSGFRWDVAGLGLSVLGEGLGGFKDFTDFGENVSTIQDASSGELQSFADDFMAGFHQPPITGFQTLTNLDSDSFESTFLQSTIGTDEPGDWLNTANLPTNLSKFVQHSVIPGEVISLMSPSSDYPDLDAIKLSGVQVAEIDFGWATP